MPTIALPHMTLRRRVWYAVLRVPAALRFAVGYSVLIRTTCHSDPLKAAPVAAAIVQDWKRELDQLRGRKVFTLEEIRAATTSRGYGTLQAFEAAEASPGAITTAIVNAWVDTTGASLRMRHQYATDAMLWATDKLPTTDSRATRQRRLSSIRRFCKDTGRPAPDTSALAVKAPPKADRAPKRTSFTVAEVEALRAKAAGQGDHVLANLITLGVHTGARLGELANLRVTSLDTDRMALKASSKTDAGDRVVPIHKALIPTLVALVASAGPDGYLLASSAANRLGERGMALSKRFTRLKVAAGYDGTLVFHSIRKTVATALQDAGCPEPTAADILGHEIETMSYGVYSTGSSLETRRTWLEVAIKGEGKVGGRGKDLEEAVRVWRSRCDLHKSPRGVV